MQKDDAQKLISTAKELGRGPLAQLAAQWDHESTFPAESVRAVIDAGLLPLAVPVQYGGLGASLPVICRVVEELGAGCVSTALVLVMHWTSLLYLGDWCETPDEAEEARQLDALRKCVFTDVLEKGALVANCYGEPGSGANIFLPFTQAEPAEGGWRITGRKLGTLAAAASYLQLHAVVSQGESAGKIIQFVLPADLPGLSMEPLSGFVGVRGAAPSRVIIENCFVPERYRFGAIGLFLRANAMYPYSTLILAAPYLGLAQAAIEYARDHIKRRKIQGFERSLAEFPQTQRTMAELVVEVEAARAMLQRAAAEAVPNPPSHVRILNEAAKIIVGEMVVRVTTRALQMCGTRMLMQAFPLERYVRDALAGALHPPTTPEAFNLIGQLFLGLDPFAVQEQIVAKVKTDERPLPEDQLPSRGAIEHDISRKAE